MKPKKINPSKKSLRLEFLSLMLLMFSASTLLAQFDDLYMDPSDDQYYSESYSDTTTDEVGNTYITNNYYGDTYYEEDDNYYYSRRIRRFYRPWRFRSYYSYYYWDWAYDWGVGYGPYYSYYYAPYHGVTFMGGPYYGSWNNPFNYQWGYNPYFAHNYGYWNWNGYHNGYWNAYNNGYYNGYYANNHYCNSGDVGSSSTSSNGVYYGHRSSTSTNTATGSRTYGSSTGIGGQATTSGDRPVFHSASLSVLDAEKRNMTTRQSLNKSVNVNDSKVSNKSVSMEKDVLPGSSQGKANNNNVLDARKGDYSSKRNFTSSTVKKGNSTGLKKSHLDKTTYSGPNTAPSNKYSRKSNSTKVSKSNNKDGNKGQNSRSFSQSKASSKSPKAKYSSSSNRSSSSRSYSSGRKSSPSRSYSSGSRSSSPSRSYSRSSSPRSPRR